LNRKPPDQAIIETLIVVHFDELIEVNTVQIKDQAQMVPPHEVISQFNDSLQVIWVILFEQK